MKPSPEIDRAFHSLKRGEGHGKVIEWLAAEKERIVSAHIRNRCGDPWAQGYLAALEDLIQQLSR